MQMNRIERLLWEESQLSAIELAQPKPQRRKIALILSIMLSVGAIVVLVSRVTIPHLNEAMTQALAPASVVYKPAADPKSESVPRSAPNAAEAAARLAPQK
jgi:hypothetical protein